MGKINVKSKEELLNEELETHLKDLENSVKKHLNAKAREWGYDDITTLCSYATSNSPIFSKEAQAAVDWRDSVWDFYFKSIADVKSNVEVLPTEDELLDKLPVLQNPVRK